MDHSPHWLKTIDMICEWWFSGTLTQFIISYWAKWHQETYKEFNLTSALLSTHGKSWVNIHKRLWKYSVVLPRWDNLIGLLSCHIGQAGEGVRKLAQFHLLSLPPLDPSHCESGQRRGHSPTQMVELPGDQRVRLRLLGPLVLEYEPSRRFYCVPWWRPRGKTSSRQPQQHLVEMYLLWLQ